MSVAAAGGFAVERVRLDAATAHADMSYDDAVVRVVEVRRSALVLGSAQADDVVDHAATAAAGVDVVRRRSGGGAVLLDPPDVAWVDVVVPAGHERARDDVAVAMHWVGAAWAGALVALGVDPARLHVHTGRLERTAWSGLVCFAGLGPGEVLLDGRKVVGVSQRRTRAGARLQSAALTRWRPDRLVSLLRVDPEARPGLVAALDAAAAGTGLAPAALADAFVAAVAAG